MAKQLQQLRWLWKQRGPSGLLRLAARRLLHRGGDPLTLARADHPFDAAHGVDTSGLLYPKEILSGHAHDHFSTAYFGVAPSRFTRAVRLWMTSEYIAAPQQYVFADIGCGKGRAVLLASTFGFRKVIGVELSPALAEAAASNAKRWTHTTEASSPIEILCADATSWHLPEDPCLVYLYNPFGVTVMRLFLQALVQQLQARRNPLYLLYIHPEEEQVFREFESIHLLWSELVPLDPEDRRDEISTDTDRVNLYRISPETGIRPAIR